MRLLRANRRIIKKKECTVIQHIPKKMKNI